MHTIAVNDGNTRGLRACKCYGSGHNRRSSEHRFDDRIRERLGDARRRDEIRTPHDGPRLAREPLEAHMVLEPMNSDAILVVPRPVGPVTAYGHLASFVRNAPDSQKHSLWRLVGELMERGLGPTPVWLSTAGAGVSWLHVRLDQRPKYYGHARYRESTHAQ